MRSINPAFLTPKTKKVAVTRNFVADTDIDPIEFELPGYYTDIILKLELSVKAGSSPSAATDWWAAVLKSMKIEPSNLKPYLDLDEARYLHYENRLFTHGSITLPTLPTANNTATVKWQYHIHPGDNFLDEFDITDVIATRGLSNLCLKMRWGSSSDLGDGFTINSGKIRLIVNYVLLQPGIREVTAFPGMALPGRTRIPSFWQPQWRHSRVRNIHTTYNSLGLEENFLNGFFLRDVLIFVKDSTDALVNNILTELQITDREGNEYFCKDFADILEDNMRRFELTSALTGVIYLDLRDIFQKTRAGVYFANAGDAKWHFTIENVTTLAPGEIAFWWRTHWVTKSREDVVGKKPAEFAV